MEQYEEEGEMARREAPRPSREERVLGGVAAP